MYRGKINIGVEIKLRDEKAKVRLEDLEGNILIEDQEAILRGELSIPDGDNEYKIVVTAESGNEEEYKLKILRISSNIEIESITFTDYDEDWKTIITKNEFKYEEEAKTYKIYVNRHLPNTTVKITTVSNQTSMLIDGSISGVGEVSFDKNLNMPEIMKIPIKLTASDGTTETRYLEILPDPRIYITGKIETENVNGEHISNIIVYKLGEIKEEIARIQTEKDGTFKVLMYTPEKDDISILDEKYELVVSKEGYLDYTITEIALVENTEMNIGEYKLIAGDTIKSGEINIDDLVSINDNYGKTVSSESGEDDEIRKYDFNEDKVVNILDRIILKKNYGKLAEKITWQELNEPKTE